jgi:hypothetical protein
MMRTSICLLFLVLGFSPFGALAQQSGSVYLVGRISPIATLAPLRAEGVGNVRAQLVSAGPNRVIANLSGWLDSQSSQVVVTLLMRSNASYELRAALEPAAAPPAVSISVEGARATGEMVVQGAMSSTRMLSAAANLSSADLLIATGSRISRGPLASPSNAIEIGVRLEVASGAPQHWSADIVFTIATV